VKVSFWAVPLLVLLAAAGGVLGARLVEAPTVVRVYAAAPSGVEPSAVVFTVAGLKCTDTAETFAAQFEGVPGVLRLEAFASPHRARLLYDPSATDPGALRKAAEAPVIDGKTGAVSFGIYRVVEVDGKPVSGSGRA